MLDGSLEEGSAKCGRWARVELLCYKAVADTGFAHARWPHHHHFHRNWLNILAQSLTTFHPFQRFSYTIITGIILRSSKYSNNGQTLQHLQMFSICVFCFVQGDTWNQSGTLFG